MNTCFVPVLSNRIFCSDKYVLTFALSTMAATDSYVPTWNVAAAGEKLNFKFCLFLINLNFKSSHLKFSGYYIGQHSSILPLVLLMESIERYQ